MASAAPASVLVVDDDPSVCRMLRRLLTRSGYQVDTAEDGEVGLKRIEESVPDLILMDVVTPKGPDGFGLCEIVRTNPRTKDVPVVFLTGWDGDAEEKHAFAVGGSAFVRKPFDVNDLEDVIRTQLANTRSAPAPKPAGLSWDDWATVEVFDRFKASLARNLRMADGGAEALSECGPRQLSSIARILNITEEEICRRAAEFVGLPFLSYVRRDSILTTKLSSTFCERNLIALTDRGPGALGVLVSNPFNWENFEALGRVARRSNLVSVEVAAPHTIRQALQAAAAPAAEDEPDKATTVDPTHSIQHLAAEILRAARIERASDIHIEPKDRHTIIRFRIDGEMQDVRTLSTEQSLRLISRFKALAGLDIAERRKPQDGAVEWRMPGEVLKLRLATSSTADGETLVIRILEPAKAAVPLLDLGMTDEQAASLRQIVGRHQGLLLLVGPTGSGKSTTIFSLLTEVDGRTRSIMTVEDPIEYRIPFANQQEVKVAAGVTFETLLKSAMRQDPDVLFLGEIRDPFSASASFDFASSGHLTLSTLHAATATSAIFRLERLGIQRPGMADSLSCVVAQRLVKRLCPECKETGPITEQEASFLSEFTDDVPETVSRPCGCASCRGTGYKGREGVFEILQFDAKLSEMVRSGASINQIRAHCIDRGDFMMFHHVIQKVRDGVCSPADAHAHVLLDEARFRNATEARQSLGVDALAPAPAVPPAEPTCTAPGALGSHESTISLARRREDLPSPAPASAQRTGRILIVEDDPVQARTMEVSLRTAGFETIHAEDGIDALVALGQHRVDAVVSDIYMPNMGGIPFLKAIVAKQVDVPVCIVTSDTGPDLERAVLQAGARDFIRKPLDSSVLVSRVRNLIR